MSPRLACLLNLLVLLVNFALVCAHSENAVRVLRATTRAAAAPLPRWSPPPNRDTPDGIGAVPHTRLLKFLALLDTELPAPQREAVFAALEHCCVELPRAAALVRASGGDPRVARTRIEHEVADRLRGAAIADDETLARLVRIVVSSAG
ncbi:MAG: hypothetical protein ACYTHK_10175 [Planctomycetota bacterium]|jgi:hypothetical protein